MLQPIPLDAPSDTHLVPRFPHYHRSFYVKQLFCTLDRDVGKLLERASNWHPAAIHGPPPNLSGHLPRVASEGDSREIERLVGDTREDVHPSPRLQW